MNDKPHPLVPKKYSIADEFKLPLPREVLIDGYEEGHPSVPAINPCYAFIPEKMRDLLAFWQSKERALKIIGDPAAGKTSLVQQFHARLRWPLYMVSCNPLTESRELMGSLMPMVDGTLKWIDGPVLKAAREGTSVLLDEFNIMEPGEASGLNMILEGYPVTIPATGETVFPKPGFKVFATENHVESRLAVTGRNVQDVANDDRFMVTYADYLPESVETQVVVSELLNEGVNADVAQMIAEQVVSIANKIRQAYKDDDSRIQKPMSTRAVIRWAALIRRFGKVKDAEGPVLYALRRAFQMNEEMGRAVADFTATALGVGNGTP